MPSAPPPALPAPAPGLRHTEGVNARLLPVIGLAILSSLVQFLGVLLWDWPVGNVFLLLWVENVIVTLLAIVRMFTVRNAPDGGMGMVLMNSFGMLFFCGVHAVFTFVLAFMTGLSLTPQMFLLPLAILVLRYAVEAVGLFIPANRPTTISEAYGFAMRRIFMLHIAIIACWGVVIFSLRGLLSGDDSTANAPLLALGILLAIKTIAEIHSIRLGPNAPTSLKFQARGRR